MARMQLIELEDQKWFPKQIRNGMTDLLNCQITCFQIYDAIVPILHRILVKAEARHVLDLCSGGGGSCRRVQQLLVHKYDYKINIELSDLYPNCYAHLRTANIKEANFSYLKTPIDAMKVPAHLKGFRTLFTSFHHFAPKEARSILRDAVANNRGIGIFELSERSVRGLILVLFSFVLTLLLTPFLRPFCLRRLFFTYVLPIIPLSYLFDGIVSQIRSYTEQELLMMAKEVDDSYHWESGRAKHHYLPISITYLIGHKR